MKRVSVMRPARGFSLVEVLVALLIIAVGMLGIAKMQALALSSTGSAGTRSLVAIEAASLAASMHSNRDYWTSAAATAAVTTINIYGGTSNYATSVNCLATNSSAPGCAAGGSAPASTNVAAYDLQQWALALAQIVPGATATITCLNMIPVNCTIAINWTENVGGLNAATSGNDQSANSAAGALQLPQYTLYVEP